MDNQEIETKVQADSETVREFIYLPYGEPINFFYDQLKKIDRRIEFLKSAQEWKECPSRSRAIEIQTLVVMKSYCMTHIQNHQLRAIMDKWLSEQEQE